MFYNSPDLNTTLKTINKNNIKKGAVFKQASDFLRHQQHASLCFTCCIVCMSKPLNWPVLWTISQVVTSDKSKRLSCSYRTGCLNRKFHSFLNEYMWRRWSNNPNGPFCLSLHMWPTNTLSKEYFWRHELIPSTRFHFPALLDHMLSCKVLVYMCTLVCLWVCVGHYRAAILTAIKTFRGKSLGLNYFNEHSDQSLLLYFHPSTKFISLCWNTQIKTTYWVT